MFSAGESLNVSNKSCYIQSGAKNKSDKAHLGNFLEFTISNSEFEN